MTRNLNSVGQGSLAFTVQQTAGDPHIVTDLTVQCIAGNQYIMTSTSGAFTATLPANPLLNDIVIITNSTGRTDGIIGRNGNRINGQFDNITFDIAATLQLKYVSSELGWIVIN